MLLALDSADPPAEHRTYPKQTAPNPLSE